jgi:hypothetical protein
MEPLDLIKLIFDFDKIHWDVVVTAFSSRTMTSYSRVIAEAFWSNTSAFPVLEVNDIFAIFQPLMGQSIARANTLRQAIIAFQTGAGLPEPPFGEKGVQLLFRALKKAAPLKPLPKLPFDRDIAFRVFNVWANWPSKAAQRNAAFFALQLASMHRFDEVASCRREHLKDVGDKGFVWTVPKSKTEQFGRGHEVHLPPNMGGLQVAQVLRLFLRMAPDDNGFLFRPTTPDQQSWVPRFKDKKHEAKLNNQTWIKDLRFALKQSCREVDPQRFASHSARSGRATSLLKQGVP